MYIQVNSRFTIAKTLNQSSQDNIRIMYRRTYSRNNVRIRAIIVVAMVGTVTIVALETSPSSDGTVDLSMRYDDLW